jgi:uncharacterized membrane protein
VDGDLLGTSAEDFGLMICLLARPGDRVDSTCPLLRAEASISEEQAKALRSAFTISPDRKFDNDPRFGLVVLSEVASRALSPGINDQGTALDVIGTATRILTDWSDALADKSEVRHANLRVPPLSDQEVLADAFGWIARDGADKSEVQSALLHANATLAAHTPARFAKPARALAAEAFSRASPVLSTSRFKGPSARRSGIRTASVFCRRHSPCNLERPSLGPRSSAGWQPSLSSASAAV